MRAALRIALLLGLAITASILATWAKSDAPGGLGGMHRASSLHMDSGLG